MMKIKIILLTALISMSCSTFLQAWQGRILLFGNDNGVWKVLLRRDPQTNQWTDFKKSPTQRGQRGNTLAAQALQEQIGGNFYQLTPKEIAQKAKYSKYNDDVTHFITVDRFSPGKELYQQARTAQSDDFVWIPFQEFFTQSVVIRPHKTRQRTFQNQVDPEVHTILRQNKQEIDAMLSIAPAQQIPQQPPAQGQGEWNIPSAIKFYNSNAPYYEFTNFFYNPVMIDNKLWPTTEQYYQAMKFNDTNLQEQIRNMRTPREAFSFARKHANNVRSDWQTVNLDVMLKAVRAKFNQDQRLKNLLLNTDDKILVEDAGQNDKFFGAGADYNGNNHLGQILMQVRDELRGAPENNSYVPHPASYYMQKPQQFTAPIQQPPFQPPTQQPQIPLQPTEELEELHMHLQLLTLALRNLEDAINPTKESCSIC